jgi:hypothetical protein
MRLRHFDAAELARNQRRALSQLRAQMFPLVEQLAASFRNLATGSSVRNLSHIEFVSAALGFIRDSPEEGCDGGGRIPVHAKPDELRVAPIASRTAGENFLGQQPFPPCGY